MSDEKNEATPDERRHSHATRRSPLADRFHDRYIPEPNTGCWLWLAGMSARGYGIIHGDGVDKAHRASWLIHNGPIPHGLSVLHHCDNPPCVNPAHLFLGTQRDNIKDMEKKGRRRWGNLSGDRAPWAKLSSDDVLAIRSRLAGGEVQEVLANEYSVAQSTVSKIKLGYRWVK